MESQVVVEVARLVSLQSTLLGVVTVVLVLGVVVVGWELWGITRTLHQITAMVAEVLRRVPER